MKNNIIYYVVLSLLAVAVMVYFEVRRSERPNYNNIDELATAVMNGTAKEEEVVKAEIVDVELNNPGFGTIYYLAEDWVYVPSGLKETKEIGDTIIIQMSDLDTMFGVYYILGEELK